MNVKKIKEMSLSVLLLLSMAVIVSAQDKPASVAKPEPQSKPAAVER